MTQSLFPARGFFAASLSALFFISCAGPAGQNAPPAPPPPDLPVFAVSRHVFANHQDFAATIEGSKDVEIRPQVNGYIDRIFVDEGAYVHKGQPLFQINDKPYREALNNAKASLAAARANQASTAINVTKLQPLVEHNVVSPVQLQTAKAADEAAQAQVAQAQAQVANAEINIGYALIKAPVDGYLGRIHFKTGSLVGTATADPLTILSEIRDVRAYFSMSEQDFLTFKSEFPGATLQEKLKRLPPVQLILADNSVYPEKGRVEMVAGQFSTGTGSISFRATFPNKDAGLRSGNTGRIRVPVANDSGLVIPADATSELQDKVFVFVVGDSNKVATRPIVVRSRSDNYYLVGEGLKAGDKVVFSGIDRLRDGMVIVPRAISLDSLLGAHPM